MRHDRLLGALGVAGFTVGLGVVFAGRLGGELAGLMSGYGWLTTGSAVYLLLGLAARRLLTRRGRPVPGLIAVSAERRT